MEGEGPVFLRSLQGTFVDFLLLCEGELFLLVVKMIAVGAGRSRGNQRFMVTEDGFIIEIKVVISDLRTGLEAFSEAVVEGCIEVIISFSNLYDIPGMAVFDAFFRIIPAQGDHAPDSQSITEDLDGFGNSLTDADAVSKGTDDLVGVRLFQLIVMNVFTDEIVDIFFFLDFGKLCSRTGKFFYPSIHRFLMIFDLALFEEIFRNKDQIGRVCVIFIFEACGPEEFRVVQAEFKEDVAQCMTVDLRDLK